MNPPLEEQEQEMLCKWLSIKNIYFFAVPNANAMSSLSPKMATIVMAKLKKTGFKTGVSDLIVFAPKKILFVEMKRAKKPLSKTSDKQKQFITIIQKYEYADGAICYGFNEAKTFIENYL